MTAIEFENISKQYRLGLISTRTLSHDLNRWFQMNIRGKEDPYLKIGEVNDRAHRGESDYVWALKDISFKVEQGDVLGIIGKNGAGKSTLLKILSKVTSPTTGTIKARGRIASLLEVGTGFHPEMTGRENIYMNGAIMGMTKAEITRKLDEIVDFSGVERYLDTPVKRYSSGMTVRLGFAIAAHLEPEILVVDEVLAVGDAEFQKKAIGKMQDVSKGEGRTVLFVSHNMAAVRSLCTKGVLLEDGTCQLYGDVNYVVDNYLFNKVTHLESIQLTNSIDIIIDRILVNNTNHYFQHINNDSLTLKIEVFGRLNRDMILALELTFMNSYDQVKASYLPSILYGDVKKYNQGKFEIREIIEIPSSLLKATYRIAVCLTNPLVETYLKLNDCFILEIEGVVPVVACELNEKRQGVLLLRRKGLNH